MFKARLKPSEQGTLERRYEFHIAEAVRSGLLGDHEKAAGHSATALQISRQLYACAREPARHRPDLAAALATHARYQRALESVALLTESAGHYAVLAAADPRRYEVDRIDVLVRIALAADAAGNTNDAIRLLREVIVMYRQAPATDLAAREAGLAKACFHLGRCLLAAGHGAEGLAITDAGLAAAEAALAVSLPSAANQPVLPGRRRTSGENAPAWSCSRADSLDPGWISTAPRPVQALAPDWACAATRAMALHAAAGQWSAAAVAAVAAVRVTGGLAALGSEECRNAHAVILGQARAIWTRAQVQARQASCDSRASASA
jgi:tetratricopeptide (TPR) repeat protein